MAEAEKGCRTKGVTGEQKHWRKLLLGGPDTQLNHDKEKQGGMDASSTHGQMKAWSGGGGDNEVAKGSSEVCHEEVGDDDGRGVNRRAHREANHLQVVWGERKERRMTGLWCRLDDAVGEEWHGCCSISPSADITRQVVALRRKMGHLSTTIRFHLFFSLLKQDPSSLLLPPHSPPPSLSLSPHPSYLCLGVRFDA